MNDALENYLASRGKRAGRLLGEGKDGAVYETDDDSAVKLHRVAEIYRRERDCYFRLGDVGLTEVAGLALPEMVDHDNDLLIIEMTIVSPPFLLDFASAYLDDPPDWPEDVVAQWHEDLRGRFEGRYDEVLGVLAELEGQAGVHLFDVHADNLKFEPVNSG